MNNPIQILKSRGTRSFASTIVISVNLHEMASNSLTFCILAGSNFLAYGSSPT